jgi:hypothetical protein
LCRDTSTIFRTEGANLRSTGEEARPEAVATVAGGIEASTLGVRLHDPRRAVRREHRILHALNTSRNTGPSVIVAASSHDWTASTGRRRQPRKMAISAPCPSRAVLLADPDAPPVPTSESVSPGPRILARPLSSVDGHRPDRVERAMPADAVPDRTTSAVPRRPLVAPNITLTPDVRSALSAGVNVTIGTPGGTTILLLLPLNDRVSSRPRVRL